MVVCTERDKLISSLLERNKPPNSQKIYSLVLAPKEHNISINVTIITNEFTLMKESLCIRQMARCGQKQSGNIKSAMIPVKYRGGKDQCLFTSMLKSNYDYFLQLRSLDSAFFTLQVLVHLDNETKRLYLDKASQKPRLCNDV